MIVCATDQRESLPRFQIFLNRRLASLCSLCAQQQGRNAPHLLGEAQIMPTNPQKMHPIKKGGGKLAGNISLSVWGEPPRDMRLSTVFTFRAAARWAAPSLPRSLSATNSGREREIEAGGGDLPSAKARELLCR